jgi:hypothetical protein
MLFTKVRYSHKPVIVGRESVVEIYINTLFDDKILKLLLLTHFSLFSLGQGGIEGKNSLLYSLKYILRPEIS